MNTELDGKFMAPALPGETDEQYTDRVTGADGTGRCPYTERRYRHCCIGVHSKCTDPEGIHCKCPCHVQAKKETRKMNREEREKIIQERIDGLRRASQNCPAHRGAGLVKAALEREAEALEATLASERRLLEVCIKVEAWLLRLAEQADVQAKDNRFQSLVEACQADAKNYRAVAGDLEAAIAEADPPNKLEPVNQLIPEQYQQAIELLDQWLADDSGDDEAAWERLKHKIEQHRLSKRPRFSANNDLGRENGAASTG